MVGKAEDVAILCLTFVPCAPRPGHPPADSSAQRGDEVGGDDFTLGENHVSAVQEGAWESGPTRAPWLAPYLAKFSLLCPSTSWLHSLLLAETLARWQIVPEAS